MLARTLVEKKLRTFSAISKKLVIKLSPSKDKKKKKEADKLVKPINLKEAEV